MTLTERLREVIRPGGSAEPTNGTAEPALRTAADPASILGGEWRETAGHAYVVIDRVYPPDYRHGRWTVGESAPAGDVCWPALSVIEPSLAARRVGFVDVETTGLAGGAGTYAFLVGFGWFENAAFRIRQLLLSGFASERVLLADVARMAADAGALATYNGRTFDLPLIESRFLLHRMEPPFAGLPHVDMLHPVRRLWGGTGGSAERWVESSAESAPHPCSPDPPHVRPDPAPNSCRLTALEHTVLGHARDGDVPGFEIPSRYFHYVRTGDARPLEGVLEHNRLDVLSLAMLTAQAAMLLEHGASAARTAREALGLGRLYQRAGMLADARACFARALEMATDATVTAEALYGCAVLSRRGRRHDEAARAWRMLLELPQCPPRLAQQASEALAVHHEHRVRDLPAARRFAAASLGWSSGLSRTAALQYRLSRLDRKLGHDRSSSVGPLPSDLEPLF